MSQYDKIREQLRRQVCTNMHLMVTCRTTSPHKRLAEMEARGEKIRRGTIQHKGRTLRTYWLDAGDCEHCGGPNPPGKEKRFCSASCRAKNHRKEKAS